MGYTGIGHDVHNILHDLQGVDRVCAAPVCAFLCDVSKSSYDEREALNVDDVPSNLKKSMTVHRDQNGKPMTQVPAKYQLGTGYWLYKHYTATAIATLQP